MLQNGSLLRLVASVWVLACVLSALGLFVALLLGFACRLFW